MSDQAEILATLKNEIVELQTKIQFQEDTIQQLDSVIVAQDERVAILMQRLKLLEEKVDELNYSQDTTKTVTDEKPPHY